MNEMKEIRYVLIKNGNIYGIDTEGYVRKAKNGEDVPFYSKRELSDALYKMPKRKSSKFFMIKEDDFIHMEEKGGAEKIFCSLILSADNKPSKWVSFADDLVTLLPHAKEEYQKNIDMISQCDKEMADILHMIEGKKVGPITYLKSYWKIRKNRRIRRECKTNIQMIKQLENSLSLDNDNLSRIQISLDNAHYPVYNYRTNWKVDQEHLLNVIAGHCQ